MAGLLVPSVTPTPAVQTGGMTSLASGTIASAATGIDISSISGTYNELQLYINGASFTSNGCAVEVRFNNVSTSSYNFVRTASGSNANGTSATTGIMMQHNTATDDSGKGSVFLSIPNYTNTTGFKTCLGTSAFRIPYVDSFAGVFHNTAAINRIQIYVTAGTFSGGSYVLYGVK